MIVARARAYASLVAGVALACACRGRGETSAPPNVEGAASAASTSPVASTTSSIASADAAIAAPLDAAIDAPLDAAGATGCTPRGEAPAGYEADAIDPLGRVDLHEGVRVHDGDVAGGERPSLDDRAWDAVDLPAYVPAKGASTFWLRERFTLSKALDGVALDAGGRDGASTIWLDGKKLGAPREDYAPYFATGLALKEGDHLLAIRVRAPTHVGGLRTYGDVAIGKPTKRRRGLVYARFHSAVDGTEQPLAVYLPTCADLSTPRPLVVALPGWNGNVHVFSHSRLMREAERRGWIVAVPDPRGNRLYTGEAEQGVLEAIDRLRADLKIDDARVALTGVSMGGAGALQIGYHYPDRFAAIAAYYGDSEYDLATYVGPILKTKENAARYSVLNFPQNARDLPVLLIHAKDDRVSAFSQSKRLADADAKLGLANHRLIAVETGGHSLAVVEETLDDVVALFARSVRPDAPPRVSFATSSARYPGAYWLAVAPAREGTFGAADVEIDAAKSRVVVHAIDAGVARATLDLARARLLPPIAITVETASSKLVIAGLPKGEARAVTVNGVKRATRADAEGRLDLGVPPVGTLSIE